MKKSQVLPLAFVLAFCSFGFQTLIAFSVQAVLGGVLTPWLLTLGAYLLGLGLGSHRAGRFVDKNILIPFSSIELKIAFLGSISIFAILFFDGVFSMTHFSIEYFLGVPKIEYILTVISFFISLWLGYYSGFELPILLNQYDTNAQNGHWIIGVHYFGTLLASILIQVILLPKLDMLYTALILGTMNLCMAIFFIFKENVRKTAWIVVFVIFSMNFYLAKRAPSFYAYYLKVFYYQPTPASWTVAGLKGVDDIMSYVLNIDRKRSLHQYIDIQTAYDQTWTGNASTILYLDTHLQFGTKSEVVYHELMVHVPIDRFHLQPKNVLILGGGDGLLAKQLLRYGDKIESIELVELDGEILRLANEDRRFTDLNQFSLKSSKVKVIQEDAFIYLRRTMKKYDFVLVDFPFPHSPDLAKLYSKEFYSLVRKTLSPDGAIALDFPLKLNNYFDGDRNDIIFNTLKSVGFEQFIAFVGYDMFIGAKVKPVEKLGDVVSDKISSESHKFFKVKDEVLEEVTWDKKYVNSVFKPKSFGRDF